MSNSIVKSINLIKSVGAVDHKALHECFNVVCNIETEINNFTDTEQGLNHIMLAANNGFNLLLKHKESYKKYTGMDVDLMLRGFHEIEIRFESLIDQE